MLLEKTNREVTHSGHGRTSTAKIKASRKLFDFFSDGVYSNKPVAIARELTANAIDSHMAAGIPNRAIEVTLPTELDPTFMVQDFGTGMSEDFIFDKYMVYAEGSTKDNNNDAIGGFGIGKASVFSYTDQFSLVSNQNGVKGVYSVFINDEGIPAVTQVATTTTDEPNGVSISFPVEQDDLKTFHDAVQTALQYFAPLPIVHNGTLNPPAYNYVGNGWMLRPTSGDLGVIIGGIRYPVATHNLDYKLQYDEKLSPLLSYGLDLVLPIGACGVALSREALSYDTRSTEAVRTALESVIDDVVATFANMFDNCNTMWEAIVALHKETNGASSSTGRAKLLAANAYWRGAKIENGISVSRRMDIGTAWMIEPTGYRRRHSTTVGNAKWENIADQHTLYPGKIRHVIVDDLPQSSKSKQIMKIKAFVEATDQKEHTLVLRAQPDNTDAAAIKVMLNKIGMPETITYTSELPEPVVIPKATPTSAGNVYVRPKVRMFTFSGGRDYHGNRIENLTPGWAKRDHVHEIDYADQPTTGIMVGMNSFDLPKGLREMCDSGILKWSELRFVNQVDANKIAANFESYDVVFEARKKALLAKFPKLAQRLAVEAAFPDDLEDVMREQIDTGRLTLTPAQYGRPFGKLAKIWQDYVTTLDTEQRGLRAYVTPALPSRMDMPGLYQSLKTNQWQARILLQNLSLKDDKHLQLLQENL